MLVPIIALIGAALTVLFSIGIGLDCQTLGRRQLQGSYIASAVTLALLSGILIFLVSDSILEALLLSVVLMASVVGPSFLLETWFAKKATLYVNYVSSVSAWGLANFARITNDDRGYIIASDLEAVLRNVATTDTERRMLCWLLDHIEEIGHEMQVYRAYEIKIDSTVEEKPVTRQVFGITRNDLETYEKRIKERPEIGGWIRQGQDNGFHWMESWPR